MNFTIGKEKCNQTEGHFTMKTNSYGDIYVSIYTHI